MLGLIQGITEFLPVSSSGHLVLAQNMLGLTGDMMAFDVFVHAGTLAAVLIVFRSAVLSLVVSWSEAVMAVVTGKASPARLYRDSRQIRLGTAIIVGSVPAAVVGLVFKAAIEGAFASPLMVMGTLAVTGTVLLATFTAPHGTRNIDTRRGFLVGLAQAVAVVPGISRSGSTIAAGLFTGIGREEAGVFSFLLAIPVTIGATLVSLKDVLDGGVASFAVGPCLAGTVVACVTGWLSLVLLMRIVRRGAIGWFGFYCLAVAVAGFLFKANLFGL